MFFNTFCENLRVFQSKQSKFLANEMMSNILRTPAKITVKMQKEKHEGFPADC